MQSFAPGNYSSLEDPSIPGPYLDVSQALRSDPETRGASQSAQMWHNQPVQSVSIERVEKFAEEGQHWVSALLFMKKLAIVAVSHRSIDLPPESHRKELALLRSRGFNGVLLLGTGFDKNMTREVLDSLQTLFDRPQISENSSSAVFEIPEIEYTAAELEMWQEEHRIDVLHISGQSDTLNRQLR